MSPFPLRTRIGDGITVAVDAPYATLVLAVASPRAVLCLSPREQDRLRMLMEAGRRCDEILDPDEDHHNRVRCIQSPGVLTLMQDDVEAVVARGPQAREALLEILRANTYGV
ncbi:MAG TPA: hypothetical protein VF710_20005 [Longimicrobium sp.]